MGKVIYPRSLNFKGPWILDNDAFIDLDKSLDKIQSDMQTAYDIALENAVEQEILKYKERNWKTNKKEITKEMKERYSFKQSTTVYLINKDETKIQDTSMSGLLRNINLNKYNPIELTISIIKGSFEFKLNVSSKYNGNLDIALVLDDDNLYQNINYEIQKWINKYKPITVVTVWSSMIFYLIIPLIFILSFITIFFIGNTTKLYRKSLVDESIAIMKDSISAAELPRAVEILLQLEIEYVPENFHPNMHVNKNIIRLWIISIIALIILAIKPNTVLGIGLNKRTVSFYKIWIKFVLIFIPSWLILPFIINKLFGIL